MKTIQEMALESVRLQPLHPQQEPVAWMYPDDYKRMQTSETFCTVYSVEVGSPTRGESTVALYTSPPQRTWVGLTHDEDDECACKADAGAERKHTQQWALLYRRAIEAKLKEKNEAAQN